MLYFTCGVYSVMSSIVVVYNVNYLQFYSELQKLRINSFSTLLSA